MIQLQSLGDYTLRVTLRRPWAQIRRICELRRAVAQVTLTRLLAEDALADDLALKTQLRVPDVALEHAIL